MGRKSKHGPLKFGGERPERRRVWGRCDGPALHRTTPSRAGPEPESNAEHSCAGGPLRSDGNGTPDDEGAADECPPRMIESAPSWQTKSRSRMQRFHDGTGFRDRGSGQEVVPQALAGAAAEDFVDPSKFSSPLGSGPRSALGGEVRPCSPPANGPMSSDPLVDPLWLEIPPPPQV